jgi:hypothetical protein
MKERYTQLVEIQRVLVDNPEHEVMVRCINGNYHVRVFIQGVVNQEAVCYSKRDIGYTARSLLRWEDKCGNISAFASAARERLNTQS